MYSYFSHPNNNCIDYFTHLRLSLYYSRRMFIASVKAIFHAFIPNLFITSTTDAIHDIQKNINTYKCNNIIM